MNKTILVRDPQGRKATVIYSDTNNTLALLKAESGREAWIEPTLVDGERLTLPLDALLANASVLKLIEERLVVGSRVEETGVVRVRKEVIEHPETVRLETICETVEVTRIPMDRIVDGPIHVRQEGDTTVVSVIEERLVVERRLVLVEEVRLTRRRETVAEERTFMLKKEEAFVERESSTGQE